MFKIEPGTHAGNLLELTHDKGVMLTCDHLKREIGGFPPLAFAVATDADVTKSIPQGEIMYLLRNVDISHVHGIHDQRNITVDLVRKHGFQSDMTTDNLSRSFLEEGSFELRVLGSMIVNQEGELEIFGDIEDCPNDVSALKIYKLTGKALEAVVNYKKGGGKIERE